ncbi:MAG: septum formation initiator family protein [Candidatus Nanopelagicales bacterium]
MALLLLLNTTLAEGAFQIQALSQQQQQLQVSQQALLLYVARNESPDAMARQATKFGMVPVTSPAFLRLSDGAILGHPAPAASPRPAVAPVAAAGLAAASSGISDGAVNMAAVPGAPGVSTSTTTDGATLASPARGAKVKAATPTPATTPKAGPTAGAVR